MNTLLDPLFRLASRLLDDSVPAADLHSLFTTGLARCDQWLESRPEPTAEACRQELELARRMGEAAATGAAFASETRAAKGTLDEAVEWTGSLPQGKVVSGQHIQPGSGRFLSVLLQEARPDQEDFLKRSLESLLRHVETRRKTSLCLTEPRAAHEAWLEKHDVSILFSRGARRFQDLRLLNAAAKLNDWAFRAHRRLHPGRALIRYLLALAEYERTARELLT